MDKQKYVADLEKMFEGSKYDLQYKRLCLEYANRLLENSLPVLFDTKHLSLVSGIKLSYLTTMVFAKDRHYKEHSIPKRNGHFRHIYMPSLTLKYLQRWILDEILINIPVSTYAHGFIPKKSIVTNAEKHLFKDCVISFDIKEFFPSIKRKTIFNIFFYYGYTKELSFILSELCTYKNQLPQGAPSSPYLSNIACLRLDKRLSQLAHKYEATYTRYADDLTFSGNYGLYKTLPASVEEIVNDEGFELNESKTRIRYKNERQMVTGINVNNREIKAPKKYKCNLKKEIYFCKKYGVEDHLNKIGIKTRFYKEHLYGKAYFINMIEPLEGKRLLNELDELDWNY